MIQELNIQGENGHSILISDIFSKGIFFSAKVKLKSDWYEAEITFESSVDRLNEFFNEINLMLDQNKGEASFINDDGNFTLDVSFLSETRGKIQISGIVIKNMMDESRLEYYMESDYHNLEFIKHSVDQVLKNLYKDSLK